MPDYILTTTERKEELHLAGIADMTLCGLDISGDEVVHDPEPVIYSYSGYRKVTCKDCNRIIDIVNGHSLSYRSSLDREAPEKDY